MSYTTAAKLLNRIGAKPLAEVTGPKDLDPLTPANLTQEVASQDSGDAAAEAAVARIDTAITQVQELADAFIRSGGYDTPLDPVPAYIESAVQDIVWYELNKDRPTEIIKERNTEARRLLDKIASGKVTLVQNDGDTADITSNTGIAVSSPDQVYTKETLNSFMGGL